LCEISADVKKPFPGFIHAKGAVSGIPVLQKCLHKERKVPVAYEKEQYY
jgi:hypothetical protein